MLTHEKVRALRALIDDFDVPNAGGLAPQQETARALCDEWIAARTVRWEFATRPSAAASLMAGAVEVGSANYLPDGTWEATLDGVHQCLFTERDRCKEYLENVARDRGYEVAT